MSQMIWSHFYFYNNYITYGPALYVFIPSYSYVNCTKDDKNLTLYFKSVFELPRKELEGFKPQLFS